MTAFIIFELGKDGEQAGALDYLPTVRFWFVHRKVGARSVKPIPVQCGIGTTKDDQEGTWQDNHFGV